MKYATIVFALCVVLSACNEQQHQEHQYTVERVKDVNGNDAFLRIDLTAGEECAIGHGYAVVRLEKGLGPENGYRIPYCHELTKTP